LALAALALINVVGVGIGFVFPSIFISSDDKGQDAKDKIYSMFLWQSIVITLICLPTYFLFRERPPTPPR
jgi:FLVCR family feline leukemia virus subgroup C receptor-related protein